jgi:hypothetical protein
MQADNLIMRHLTRFQPFAELMVFLSFVGVFTSLFFASVINEQSLTYSITLICMAFAVLCAVKMVFTQTFIYLLLAIFALLVPYFYST